MAPAEVAREPVWPASLAIGVALGCYVILPAALVIDPRWLIPLIEVALVVPLTVTHPHRHPEEDRRVRAVALGLIALLSATNAVSTALLVHRMLGGATIHGRQLVYSAMLLWLTNVLVFALWFWELDRGGPGIRGSERERMPDFLYPQMTSPELAPRNWRPGFLDYLYVALTNAAAFSPTDTMPLSVQAKMVMGLQSLISLVTIGLVVSRAVNIL